MHVHLRGRSTSHTAPPTSLSRDLSASERAAEHRQQAQYDSIIEKYEAHYSDEFSQRYRETFIHACLTQKLDVRGKKVLEAMCGSGPTTDHLLSLGAQVTGLDISPKCIEMFRRAHPTCGGRVASMFQTGLPNNSYDAVVVVGGLHHLHPGTDRAVEEIHRVLKPGGHFCFAEANRGSWLNGLRRIWYKIDPLFEENETPLDLEELESRFADRFEFVFAKYQGNIAYLLVFNSMVFRIPLRLKRQCAPILLNLEAFVQRHFSSKRVSCFFVAQWRKK
jgi:SAM-dependent methyltransferase